MRSWAMFSSSPDLEITTITHLNSREQLFALLGFTPSYSGFASNWCITLILQIGMDLKHARRLNPLSED